MVASTATQNGIAPAAADSTTDDVGAVANGDGTASAGSISSNNNNSNNNNITLPLKTLPKGKYTLVGIDIDTTGRRLIDEIVQLAAFTPKNHFEQYIMPYMNLNPAARQRHQVRVISIGFYRMLKSMQTYKIIKSKSEIAALKDFLDWLEALKAKDASSAGIILVYHEERKFIPYMILESLKKYNLLDRFLNTVKSFANGLNLAKANANDALQHYTLRKLSKVLSSPKTASSIDGATATVAATENGVSSSTTMAEEAAGAGGGAVESPQKSSAQAPHERELFDGNASVRAKLAYEVAIQLANQQQQEQQQKESTSSSPSSLADSSGALEKLLAALRPYAQPIDCDLNELQTQNENLERQNSFRPVFLNYFKTTLYHRVRAVKFRIILAEQGYDLQTLNAIWCEKQGREGLNEVLQVIEELKPEDKTELADLFDSYFDPAKATIKPVVKNNNRRRNRRGVRNNIKTDNGSNSARPNTTAEQGAGGDKPGAVSAGQQQTLPDSTTQSPTPLTAAATAAGGGGKPQRGKRNPRSRNNSLKSQTPPATPETNATAAVGVAAPANNTAAPPAVVASN